ncbi:LuxR C-terminal-related transcriptional regulator [Streptomyces sp. NPDC007929]|uniref:LuxR C-terminal-related transcriptional regulator n=1 Tax=unclassified Streptomyces TaxID=2593676 RepID=UPI0036EB84A9
MRLPRAYRRLVQCLAVLGEEVPLQRLGELVEHTQEVAPIVEAAAEAGLVLWHPGEGRVSVAGPMRTLVIATMSAPETCFAHGWAARHAQGAAALLHRAAAARGPDEDLARQLDAQARRLAARGRPARAAELARRAADVSAGAGRAARRTADAAEFALRAHDLEHARRALARVEADTASARHRALAGRLAVLEGRFAEGALRLGEACRELRLAGEDGGLEAAVVWAVEARWLTGTPAAELREHLARWAPAHAGDPYWEGARRCLNAVLTASAEGPVKALSVLTAAPRASMEARDRAAVTEAWLRLEAGDAEGCEAAVRTVLGGNHVREAALVVRGHAQWLRGAWGPAEATGRVALRSSSPLWRARGQELLDLIAAARGSGTPQPTDAEGHPGQAPPDTDARPVEAFVPDVDARPTGAPEPDTDARRTGASVWDADVRPTGASEPGVDVQPTGTSVPDADARPAGVSVWDVDAQPTGISEPGVETQPVETSVPEAVARLFRALVADADGTQAAACLTAPEHRLALDVFSGPLLPWRKAELARAAVTAGDTALAASLLGSLRRAQSAGLPPWVRACASGVEARAMALTGSREATARLYAEADAAAGPFESAAPWYYARYQADHAEFLAATGRRRDAVDRYRAAWTIAARLGAEPLRARCAAGLRALRMPGRTEPFALTARETEVARLVSSGMSNREVAARLFVTPASVGFHLGNIYGKLGIRSRYELRRWWAGRDEG